MPIGGRPAWRGGVVNADRIRLNPSDMIPPPNLPNAACREAPAEIFDLEASKTAQWTAKREFCQPCPVRFDCLQHAMTYREVGVWGGRRFNGRRSWPIRRPKEDIDD